MMVCLNAHAAELPEYRLLQVRCRQKGSWEDVALCQPFLSTHDLRQCRFILPFRFASSEHSLNI